MTFIPFPYCHSIRDPFVTAMTPKHNNKADMLICLHCLTRKDQSRYVWVQSALPFSCFSFTVCTVGSLASFTFFKVQKLSKVVNKSESYFLTIKTKKKRVKLTLETVSFQSRVNQAAAAKSEGRQWNKTQTVSRGMCVCARYIKLYRENDQIRILHRAVDRTELMQTWCFIRLKLNVSVWIGQVHQFQILCKVICVDKYKKPLLLVNWSTNI